MSYFAKLASALLLGVALAASFQPIAPAASAAPLEGTFALQAGAAKSHGFLRATAAHHNPLERRLDIWMTRAHGTRAILRYTVDMTKLLHVIVVGDDFGAFLHVHPVLGADGHFTIDQRFPAAGLYRIYADGEPEGLGQQVFRFDVSIAGGAAAGTRSLAATGRTVSAGPYAVAISTTSVEAGKDAALRVHIRRGGKPARDLHPYLGALAHAVFINAADLSYAHVHPMPLGADAMDAMPGMDMSSMHGTSATDMKPLPDSATSAPDMQLHLHLREAGTYKLWLQFRGGTALQVAPFVITAR